jgi:dTDP-4-amino-4,6-dideoxygalactose transaminase
MSATRVPFNRPTPAGDELTYIGDAFNRSALAGNGTYGRRCAAWLEGQTGTARALVTASCSAALEMGVRLAGIGPGDEVIMPSFTFVSTATAVLRAGGVPVFADIEPDTLNLDPRAAEAVIGPRTKALIVVHYGGVAADMEALGALAERTGLTVIEDAAHAICARWRGRHLGSIGTVGTLSFHDTKNLQCGEGGALLVNDETLVAQAEVMHGRGTNRSRFERGEIDRYTWVGEGSNYLLGELSAAYLWGQFEHAEAITAARLSVWRRYWDAFADLEARELVRRPIVPLDREHNGHIFYLLLPDRARRDDLIARMAAAGVQTVFHYVPLHSSAAGRRLSRAPAPLPVTDDVSERLVRLPLSAALRDDEVERVIDGVHEALATSRL